MDQRWLALTAPLSNAWPVAVSFDKEVDERPELPGVLGEFRDALEAEARAVRSGSGGNAVVLRQGRRIVHGAGLHHYAFQVDFPQRLPVDAPAKLVIEGRAPVDVIVAEVKGLSVTVVSPADLGQTIAGASLQTDMSFLLECLITRLEEVADQPNEIGDRILGTISPRAGRSDAPVSSRYTLLPEQDRAAASTRRRRVHLGAARYGQNPDDRRDRVGAAAGWALGAARLAHQLGRRWRPRPRGAQPRPLGRRWPRFRGG
jgi:hypothetical protein